MRFSAEARRGTFAANVKTRPIAFTPILPSLSSVGIEALRARSPVETYVWPRDGSGVIDLTERFRQLQPADAAQPAQETDEEFQARVDRLLAEKPPQWPEFAFWGAITVMFTGGVIGICACLYS